MTKKAVSVINEIGSLELSSISCLAAELLTPEARDPPLLSIMGIS